MSDLNFKLSDIYTGYSPTSTRDLSLPDAADAEKTSGIEQDEEVEQVAELAQSGANKKSILTAVGLIAIIGVVMAVLH